VALQNLKTDPSLRYTESGRALLRWLFRHAVGADEWRDHTEAAPPHCAYTIAALARTWAAEWTEFARLLEQRTSTRVRKNRHARERDGRSEDSLDPA
jgi:hypothetical protein